ncbi:MAG: SAM-dependent methyltransferase [Chlorobi bacterium]|nr:SAM-dependent methyltransferase [Chlorobiota bacterium]
MKTGLYLIPTTLGSFDTVNQVLPDNNNQITHQIKFFIVEQIRTARRFLKKINHPVEIDDMTFYELNKHTDKNMISHYLDAAKEGESLGLISEAGTPCVADPGSVIVRMAHERGIDVFPLVGPNSIILSLMASGFNGQSFAFNGYLPLDKGQRAKKIQQLEALAYRNNQTQIFIETPYRNSVLLDALITHCKPSTMICVASNLTLDDQYVKAMSRTQWAKEKVALKKKPTIFLVSKP